MVESNTRRSKAGPYVILKTLGEGGFGKVKKAVHETDKQMVAVKFIKPEINKADIQSEVLILKRLNHPNLANIVDYHEKMLYTKKDGRILEKTAIVMELAEKGSLFEFLKTSSDHFGRGFREHIARTHFLQLIDALEYCHKQKIAHRDIKPDNVLLDANYNLRLADFGWAKSTRKPLKTSAGTKGYQAPEIVEGKFYDGTVADIFTAGIMLFILISGHPPFMVANATDPWYKNIYKGNPEGFWEIHEKRKATLKDKEKKAEFYSTELKDLVTKLLACDPDNRPKIGEIKEHPWCKGPTATSEEMTKEFKGYMSLIEEKLAKAKAEKKKSAETGTNVNQGAFEGYRAYRDGANEQDIDKELAEQKLDVDLKCKRELYEVTEGDEYPASTIYSNLEPNLLFKKLILIAIGCMSQDLKFNDKKYKFKGEITVPEDLEGMEVTVTLYKHDDETTAISFTKSQGDQLRFLNFIQEKIAKQLTASTGA